jgi:hypothetical protein
MYPIEYRTRHDLSYNTKHPYRSKPLDSSFLHYQPSLALA